MRNKLASKRIGPYRVIQCLNDVLNYQIVDVNSLSAKPKIVHYNRLKPKYEDKGQRKVSANNFPHPTQGNGLNFQAPVQNLPDSDRDQVLPSTTA